MRSSRKIKKSGRPELPPPFGDGANFIIKYQDLSFKIEFTNFKHIGIFPEQAVNWQFIIDKIKEKKSSTHKDKEIKALNLFAYTGGATVACAYADCNEVVHVDASKK